MAINNYIPTVWAARLLENLHKQLKYAQAGVVNSDYEGEISDYGDTVRITSIGAITISNYTRDSDITGPQALTDASQMLVIDQGKTFNFAIDDVDARQARGDLMDDAMREAAYGLADAADQYVAAAMVAGTATANLVGTTASPKTDLATAGQAYVWLLSLKTALDNANVPTEGRFVIIPPWYEAYLLQDARFVSFGTGATDDRLRNGSVGRAAGFNIILSNNVPFSSGPINYKVIAGYPGATTWAQQILKMEAFRPEKRFSDALKGLHVYGAQVTRPTGLAVLSANPT